MLLGLGNLDEAEKYLQEAEKLLINEKDERFIVAVYRYYGLLEFKRKNNDKSIEYFEKAIVIAKRIKHNKELGFLYTNIAAPYKALKNYEVATYYLDLSKKTEAGEKLLNGNAAFNGRENEQKKNKPLNQNSYRIINWNGGCHFVFYCKLPEDKKNFLKKQQ